MQKYLKIVIFLVLLIGAILASLWVFYKPDFQLVEAEFHQGSGSEDKELASFPKGLSDEEQNRWNEFVEKRKRTIYTPQELEKRCNERITEFDEYYGEREVWPFVSERYPQQELTDLGILFASIDCGEEYVAKNLPDGVNRQGIYLTVHPEPSKKFEETLKEIGFVFVEEGYRYHYAEPENVIIPDSYYEKWKLVRQVSLAELRKLKEFVDEPWSVDRGALK